ncbi:TPA: replication initiation factor domain-containing protein [Pseudomonas aeruginosa]|nr:replication initiation factor domain-containing protein [Pseudomonas aeruginosa]HDP4779092.1 replication initiation factor domain-containing protein [Pseudomonas aeruginosa]HDP4811165.1 replication initiation factor domain-containing protein [Pseudomonas aeruginosa]HDP4817518.1 replication initiation factor domain-containing protein [Pseudomonas aeruginosa]HDP4823625.1 replication initiation factor domain-containing protein [Pseudomonas aeruginosa]
METDISIDRLTLVGYDTGMIESYLKYSEYISFIGFSRNYGFRHSYQGLKGELLEIGEKGKIRLDFNPNTANMEQVRDIVSRLKYLYLTRLDVAVDYFGIDLSEVEWTSPKRRKQNLWLNQEGQQETLYIGAPSSERRYRIYNKKLERLEKKEESDPRAVNGHWRVEVQQRFNESNNILDPVDYFAADLFDIRPYRKVVDLDHIDKPMERIIIAGLISRPSELMNLSKNARGKYKKMIQEARERSGVAISPEPIEVYTKEKDLLADQLTSLFSHCAKTVAQV